MTLALRTPPPSTSTSKPEATVNERPHVVFLCHRHHRAPWGLWERVTSRFGPARAWGHFRQEGTVTFAEVLARCLGAVASPDRQTFHVNIVPALDDQGEELIAAVRAGRPLVRSEELRALARRALAANREPADIDAWAGQLARDVADATD